MAMFQTILVLIFFGCQTQSSTPNFKFGRSLKTFTLEELVPIQFDFFPERLSVQWISDSEYIFRDPGAGVKKVDTRNGSFETVIAEVDLLKQGNVGIAEFSTDGVHALAATNRRRIYRYSSIATYSVYNSKRKEHRPLIHNPLQVVKWGNGLNLAYVFSNNVYYVADVNRPDVVEQLTTEGVPGQVYFGATDWLYEEEMLNAADALWFSPKDTYLAVGLFNDTEVEAASFTYYGNSGDSNNVYPTIVRFKYPKAGRTNPKVGLRVFKLNEPGVDPWNIPAPVDVVGLDHILGSVNWATDHNLIVLWLNRRQNVSVLVNCDLNKDKCSILKENTEIGGWIDVQKKFFNTDGTKMVEIMNLFYNDLKRYPHAGMFDLKSLASEDLSPGNSTVTEVVGWNDELNTVYYIVAPSDRPWLRQLWATCAGVARCVTCKEAYCNAVSAEFSPNSGYAIVTCSATNNAPTTYLYDSQKDTLKFLMGNKKLDQKLSQYRLPMTLFNIITLSDGHSAHVKLMLPPEIHPGKKYPMIVRVYAGPGTSRVKDEFERASNTEYYNVYQAGNRSFVIAHIDVAGSGIMGVGNLHSINNALGGLEVSQTLNAIKRLIELYTFIDASRIGVWGWSYGGFVSTMMLVRDTEGLVTCAAAVAPVTNWLYYDTIYTERYMSTPQDNPLGYKNSDLTDRNMVERLRGRTYLLVHGSADDNVHIQHSLQLSKQLQHADIDFEQMSYTDENHSLIGVSRHFYHTLDNFWTNCFYDNHTHS